MSVTKLYNVANHSFEEVDDQNLESAIRSGVFRLPAGQSIRGYDVENNPYIIDNRTLMNGLTDIRIELAAEKAERNKMEEAAEKPLLASVAAAARGASFGLSDTLAASMGYAEDLRRLKEANPTASTIGEIAGTVGSMIALPGGGLVGGAARVGTRAAGVAERAIAGTVLKGTAETAKSTLAKDIALRSTQQALTKGTGGLVEGALYGVGQTISEASLGDPKEAAEHLISNVTFSGLLNGAFMGAGGAFGAILRKPNGSLSKVEVQAIRDKVDNLKSAASEIDANINEELGKEAENLISKGNIQDPGIIQKIREGISAGADISELMLGNLTGAEVGAVDKIAKKYVNLVAKARSLDEDTVKVLNEVATDRKMLKTVIDYMDNAPEAMQQLGRSFENVAQTAEAASQAFALDVRRLSIDAMPTQFASNVKEGRKIAETALKQADSVVAKLKAKENRQFYNIAGLKELITPLEQFREALPSLNDNKQVLQSLIDLKRGVGKALAPYRERGFQRAIDEQNTLDELNDLYKSLSGLAETESAFSPKIVGENKAINKAVREFINIQDEMQSKFYSKRRINGQNTYVPDPDKFFRFIRSDEARNMLKNDIFEEWTQKTANLLRTAQNLGIETELFQEAGTIVDGFIKTTAELRATKAAALAVSALESHTGKSLQRMLYGYAAGSVFGGVFGAIGTGVGYALDNPVQMLRILNRAQDGVVKSKSTMAKIIDDFSALAPKTEQQIGDAATTAGASVKPTKTLTVPRAIRLGIVQGYEEDDREIDLETLLTAPIEDTVTRVLEMHAELNTVMPSVQSQIGAQVFNAVEFLKSKAPTDPNSQYQVFPTQQPYVMPDSVRAKFERYVDAINDPLQTLEYMAQGKLTPEHVEALQAVYPSLYSQAQRTVLEVLGQKNDLTFQQKVQLNLLLQAPTMPAFNPQVFGSIQMQYAIAEAEEKAKKVPQSLGQNQLTSFDKAMNR